MSDRRVRTILNLASRIPPPICKLPLKVVGHTDEVLVEPADVDGIVRAQRKIAPHESIDLPTLRGRKLFRRPRSANNFAIPGLQDPAGDQPVSVALRPG